MANLKLIVKEQRGMHFHIFRIEELEFIHKNDPSFIKLINSDYRGKHSNPILCYAHYIGVGVCPIELCHLYVNVLKVRSK